MNERLASGLRPTLFLAQLSNLLAGNISIVHGVTGSSRTFMGEEVAGADAVRIAAARLAEGRGGIALVGGAYVAGRWDMLLLYALGGLLRRGGWAPHGRARRHHHGQRGRLSGAGNALPCGGARGEGPRRTRRDRHRLRAAHGRGHGACVRCGAARQHGRALRPGYAVVSGATGAAGPTEEEAGFLADLRDAGPAQGAVRHTAEAIGHAIEAAFPANLALGALALAQPEAPPQALVTGFGAWRGEALALLEPVREGRRA